MTKQEIVNYVVETPHNVNKRILGQQLDELQKNVSWNDLKDKPFYTEMVEKTVECVPDSECVLEGFPAFAVGDTVTVKIDGVEYSLIASDDDGWVTIGDSFADFENGTGQFGWLISDGYFGAKEAHTVSYMAETVHKLDVKYVGITVEDISNRVVDCQFDFTTVGDGMYFSSERIDFKFKTWDKQWNETGISGTRSSGFFIVSHNSSNDMIVTNLVNSNIFVVYASTVFEGIYDELRQANFVTSGQDE